MSSPEIDKTRRISIDLPEHLIARLDQLKPEWGLRGRGAVLKRLLEEILVEDNISDKNEFKDNYKGADLSTVANNLIGSDSIIPKYNETKALVLVGKGLIDSKEKGVVNQKNSNDCYPEDSIPLSQNANKIDLPGFVQKKTHQLKVSLGKKPGSSNTDDLMVTSVREVDIKVALNTAIKHWYSLYGQDPGETVVEASMIWLARDIWPNVEGTEGCTFTWSAANKCMQKYLKGWANKDASFDRVIVIAGVLEDPFATENLPQRMPSLIRRFVNSFRRSKNITSFETLESTMTVHGALKILSLPTEAGSSLTLKKVRAAYKKQAVSVHPDAGGNTESMRRLNEAYQLLKELYRQAQN